MRYFIKDNYYFDIDTQNQLRLTGPGNHLLCGISFPRELSLEVVDVNRIETDFSVTLSLPVKTMAMHIPLVADIRTLRSLIESEIPHPTYEDLVKRKVERVMPRLLRIEKQTEAREFHFWNEYQEDGQRYVYGCVLVIPSPASVYRRGQWLHLHSPEASLTLTIKSLTNIQVPDRIEADLFKRPVVHTQSLDAALVALYKRLGEEIEHLIRSKKTSSFEYGTIFPRDWIEAADLGENDFTPETVAYMYEQSMRYISEKGEGWHEDIIGDYKTKLAPGEDLIDRKMIDIEPHYILGFPRLPADFLARSDIHQKLQLVAHFVVQNAREQRYLSFKRLPDQSAYYLVGNWRDSAEAFPRQKSPLSPFDVNCVFYPYALETIRKHGLYFDVEQTPELDQIIDRWHQNKLRFRLYHDDNLIGYSLALHGKKNIPLPIAHLDEAYDLFYGFPSMEEVDSFARKLIDPDFFYTPVGPLLVDADDDYFSHRQYHGKVIWPKQAAFAVAGLMRQLQRGSEQQWPEPVLAKIRESVRLTCEACFTGWRDLHSVPELYYYDASERQAKLYTDQENFEGQMSLIQLWSAVGARRIIHEYLELNNHSSPNI